MEIVLGIIAALVVLVSLGMAGSVDVDDTSPNALSQMGTPAEDASPDEDDIA
jgi:hypothetical protein